MWNPPNADSRPNSTTLSGLCPRCGLMSSFEVVGEALPLGSTFAHNPYTGSASDPCERVVSLRCRHCGQGVAVVEEIDEDTGPQSVSEGEDADEMNTWHGVHWWPHPEAQVSSDVPPGIASAFAEAVKAASAGCPRASAAMARCTLEEITKEKGQTKGDLVQRLAALAANGELVLTLADWSKEVRVVGNAGVHTKTLDPVSEEDAQQMIAFMRQLIQYLYEMPADLARRRERSQP